MSHRAPKPPPTHFDLVEEIFAADQARDRARTKLKHEKMAKDSFDFFRGSALAFYKLWGHRHAKPGGPLVWICGDAHWENFGSYRSKNKVAYFDLTDFDQACLAPIEAEIGRALAAHYAAHGARLAPFFLSAYRRTLLGGKPQHIEREVAKGRIAELLSSVKNRRRKKFIAEWTAGGRIRAIEGQTFRLPASEKRRARQTFRQWAKRRKRKEFFQVLDLCGSLSGIGNLGLRRYLVLVRGGRRPHLIDMKEAGTAAAVQFRPQRQPSWSCEAERIATVQCYTQYVPIAHLGWIDHRGISFVLSDFQPTEDKIDSQSLPRSQHEDFARKMGRLLAWAHLRTASWKGAAGVDELMAYAQTLSAHKERALLRDAAQIGRIYQRAFAGFRRLVV